MFSIKKQCYHFIFNKKPPRKTKKIVYDYGNIKNIEIKIGSGCAEISFESGTSYRLENVLEAEKPIFFDCIRKLFVLYLLLNGKPLKVKRFCFDNGQNQTVDFTKEIPFPYYQLCEKEFLRPLAHCNEQSPVIRYYACTPKSKQDTRTAALYSYIISKAQSYEIERFQYLWIAMNGVYNFITNTLLKTCELDGDLKEYQQHQLFLNFLNLGEKLPNPENAEFIADDVISILFKYKNLNISIHDDIENQYPEFEQEIKGVLVSRKKGQRNKYGKPISVSVLGYLLIGLPYYIRCKVFHADKATLLICHRNDKKLNAVRMANNIMESFLDEYLYKLFDESYYKKQITSNNKLLKKTKEFI